jgi:hypothetical protein
MHARELQLFNFYSLRIQDLCLVKQNNLQMVSAIGRPFLQGALASMHPHIL